MNFLSKILASSRYVVLIAVLAVLFLREVVSWDGTRNLLELGAALTLIIGVLIFYLCRKSDRQE